MRLHAGSFHTEGERISSADLRLVGRVIFNFSVHHVVVDPACPTLRVYESLRVDIKTAQAVIVIHDDQGVGDGTFFFFPGTDRLFG